MTRKQYRRHGAVAVEFCVISIVFLVPALLFAIDLAFVQMQLAQLQESVRIRCQELAWQNTAGNAPTLASWETLVQTDQVINQASVNATVTYTTYGTLTTQQSTSLVVDSGQYYSDTASTWTTIPLNKPLPNTTDYFGMVYSTDWQFTMNKPVTFIEFSDTAHLHVNHGGQQGPYYDRWIVVKRNDTGSSGGGGSSSSQTSYQVTISATASPVNFSSFMPSTISATSSNIITPPASFVVPSY